MIDPIRAASIRALYVQMRNTRVAVLFIVAYMIGATVPFNRWPPIALWVAGVLAMQLWRERLRDRFARADPPDATLEHWARAFLIQQAVASLVWGSSMILFAHPDQPVTVALTLCCLFSVAAGAVPAQAYTPASFYVLATGLFSIALGRLTVTGSFAYIWLGIAAALFGLAMAGYCTLQAGIVRESLRIRFENETLVAALKEEKVAAEQARQLAEQASIAKSQFLAAASHDLRQPLYALSLFSASLHELKLDAEGQAVVARIHDSIGVMEGLFEGLLDLSRLEAGVVQPRLEPVSIDALFDHLSQIFWPIARERGLELRFRSDGEWIRSDPALVEQILANLTSNALRATEAGGVLIAVRHRGDALRLEVWDTGRGIAPDDIERIFGEFVQLDNAARDRRRGLGLGLAIARRAASLLDSTISVASRPGIGSRFAFIQPVCDPPEAEPTTDQPRATAPCNTNKRVLVVEDDRDVRSALEELFSRWGADATLAGSAQEALALLETEQRFDLVIADYRLPGDVNGLTMIERLQGGPGKLAPHCVLVTGDVDPALLARAEAARVPLLLKPLKPDRLRGLIDGV